jgi:hypothetical protein
VQPENGRGEIDSVHRIHLSRQPHPTTFQVFLFHRSFVMKHSFFIAFLITSVAAQFLGRRSPLPAIGTLYERNLLPRQQSCSSDQVSCSFGGCCPGNTTCIIVSNAPACCAVGANCGQQTSASAFLPSTSDATTETPPATSSAPATPSASQGTCGSGFTTCTDGTGGCCPAGSQVGIRICGG